MKALYDLKEKLQRELDEIARKPEMNAGDLETVHKLTDTIKNIDKICALEEDGGYSEAGDWEMEGPRILQPRKQLRKPWKTLCARALQPGKRYGWRLQQPWP